MTSFLAPLCLSLGLLNAAPSSQEQKPATAGPTERGFLLPNGWTLTPAGKHVVLTDLPLNIVPLADSHRALVATSGYNKHELSLIDLEQQKVIAREAVAESWFGLAVSRDQGHIWWSGGGRGRLHEFALKQNTLSPEDEKTSFASHPAAAGRNGARGSHTFRSGLFLDAETQTLYSLDIDAGTISAVDLKSGKVAKSAVCGGRPYDVVLSRNRAMLYVSDWAGRAVLAVRPEDLHVVSRIAVGEHPNQLALHPKDDRLFVACASTNNVSVIDTKQGVVNETISTSLFPKAPEGSTPDALAIAPDGKTLFVVNADNNCAAVVDITTPNESQVKGFIPTGWYPTAVAVTPDGKNLLIGVGKGLQTKANPFTRKPKAAANPRKTAGRRLPFPYIGTTLSGALSIVPIPDDRTLATYTAQVYA
ncbi:MAG TPA: beta-propeller fold lactonase family protein, partial [Planctomycetaceae bacterium]|nr:beta-propeller fold lactonase family protein [Planctomycetaceae bacterium]